MKLAYFSNIYAKIRENAVLKSQNDKISVVFQVQDLEVQKKCIILPPF